MFCKGLDISDYTCPIELKRLVTGVCVWGGGRNDHELI